METHKSHRLSLGRGKASVIFLDFWHIRPFQMAHTGANHPPLLFHFFPFFLVCFHAPVSLLLYFPLCICSRHQLFLSSQHLFPNLLIKTSEIAFEKPVCPACSWPRDRQTLGINEILLLGIQLLNRVMQKLRYYFLLPRPLECPSACPLWNLIL